MQKRRGGTAQIAEGSNSKRRSNALTSPSTPPHPPPQPNHSLPLPATLSDWYLMATQVREWNSGIAWDLTGWSGSEIGGDNEVNTGAPTTARCYPSSEKQIYRYPDELQSFGEFEMSADRVKLAEGVGPQRFPPPHLSDSVSLSPPLSFFIRRPPSIFSLLSLLPPSK